MHVHRHANNGGVDVDCTVVVRVRVAVDDAAFVEGVVLLLLLTMSQPTTGWSSGSAYSAAPLSPDRWLGDTCGAGFISRSGAGYPDGAVRIMDSISPSGAGYPGGVARIPFSTGMAAPAAGMAWPVGVAAPAAAAAVAGRAIPKIWSRACRTDGEEGFACRTFGASACTMAVGNWRTTSAM